MDPPTGTEYRVIGRRTGVERNMSMLFGLDSWQSDPARGRNWVLDSWPVKKAGVAAPVSQLEIFDRSPCKRVARVARGQLDHDTPLGT